MGEVIIPRMRSAVIIYNPAAGRFSVKPFIKDAARELESAGWKVDAVETKSGDHAIELAKEAAAEKMEAAFAVGGDGTIGQVASGLIGSDTALGALPAGTANVWGTELGLYPFYGANWWMMGRNARSLANAPLCSVDVGVCNDYYFMLWAGIGLDALTIRSLEPRVRWEKFFSTPEYAVTTIWNASQWHGLRLRLWTDDHEVEGQFILAVANNIRHYMGGYANLSPDAYIDDGIIDLWLLNGNSLVDAFRHAYDLSVGRHLTSNEAQRIPFQTLRVEAESPFWIQTDGESREETTQANISIRVRALKMLMPASGYHLLKYHNL